jgi:uncharacterized protein YndB with AHSA1/START domain
MEKAATTEYGRLFRLKRRFEAPREEVFGAWTKAEVLKQWWCPNGWTPAEIEIDLRAGGAFRIGMRRLSGGPAVYVRGCFDEVRPPEWLAYTWRWENAFEEMRETRVTVEFRAIGSATELLLTLENLPELSLCLRHRSGWLAALDRIESAFA